MEYKHPDSRRLLAELWATPEIRVLRLLARPEFTGSLVAETQQLLAEELDWQNLYELSLWHGVAALVYRNLSAHFSELLPSEQAKQFKQYLLMNTQSNLVLLRELLNLHGELNQLGIPHLFFKGLIVGQMVYSDLSLRKCGDIDVLVLPDDFPQAKAWFIKQGFVQELTDYQEAGALQSGLWHEQRRFKVDLHFGVSPIQWKIPEASIFEKVTTHALADHDMPVMDTNDMIITYAVNAVKEYWNQSLYHYSDLYGMLIKFDPNWHDLLLRAKQLNAQPALISAVTLLDRLFGMPVPAEIKQRQSDINLVARELELRFFEPGRTDRQTGRGDLLFFEHSRDFFIQLNDSPLQRLLQGPLRYLVPNAADIQWIRLPKSISFLYYFLRPIRLSLKYIAKARSG